MSTSIDEALRLPHYFTMEQTKPNLLDPAFEPSDEQLGDVTQSALRTVRARAAAAAKREKDALRVAKSVQTAS